MEAHRMDALIRELVERLNLNEQQAQGAVEVVMNFIRTQLPPELGTAVTSVLGGSGLSGLNTTGLLGPDGQLGIDDIARNLGGTGLLGPDGQLGIDDIARNLGGTGLLGPDGQLGIDDITRNLGGLLGGSDRR
jgi:hemin uptake protein HemP